MPVSKPGSAARSKWRSSLQLIRDLSQRSVDKIGDVAGAIKEQSQASQDVARNVEQIAQMNDSTNRSVQESHQLAQQLKDLSAALNDSLNRFRVFAPAAPQKPPLPAAFSSDAYNAVGSRGLRFFALALAGSGVAGHHGVTIQQQATVQRLPEPVPRTDFTQRRCTALAVATGTDMASPASYRP
jgi:ABC-type transporter Mla subunit MlaD